MLNFGCYIVIIYICSHGIDAYANHHSDIVLYYTKENSNGQVEVHKGVPKNDQWTSRGYFDNKINRTGFGYLELETNINFDSLSQAISVGYLEGYLTADLIYSRWVNTVKSWCFDDNENCELINNFVTQNTKWIKKQAEASKNEPYWYQVKLFYVQLVGLLEGYNSQTKFEKLGWSDLLWLNLMTEIGDIQEIINATSSVTSVPDSEHCSALVKIMPNNSDVYFGHATWGDYSEMLRILKKYVLRYMKSDTDKSIIPGFEISTSSYPGALISIDDFYLVSSGLAVMETTNAIFNKTLYKDIKPEGIVWEEIRSLIANRLAVDGKTWHDIFKNYNSGTYNNQWMVFDYNKFKQGQRLQEGALWVGEQIPHHYIFEDVTDILNKKGFWSSYNIPYFKDIYRMSGYDEVLNKNGSWFSYTEAPRPKIFNRDQGKVKDMDSFMSLMRSNDFTKDPFAICNCTPPYSAAGAIASRKDLNPANGSGIQAQKSAGATDAKITNSSLFKELKFMAVSGPTTGTDEMLPVFKWSESPFTNKSHMSHPDEFDFYPVTVDWTLVEDNSIH